MYQRKSYWTGPENSPKVVSVSTPPSGLTSYNIFETITSKYAAETTPCSNVSGPRIEVCPMSDDSASTGADLCSVPSPWSTDLTAVDVEVLVTAPPPPEEGNSSVRILYHTRHPMGNGSWEHCSWFNFIRGVSIVDKWWFCVFSELIDPLWLLSSVFYLVCFAMASGLHLYIEQWWRKTIR